LKISACENRWLRFAASARGHRVGKHKFDGVNFFHNRRYNTDGTLPSLDLWEAKSGHRGSTAQGRISRADGIVNAVIEQLILLAAL
jgi:hypothetical protein